MLHKKRIMTLVNDKELYPLVESVLDMLEEALTDYKPVVTPFYDPSVLDLIRDLLKQIDDLKIISHGGYQGAKRKRLEFRPLYYLPPLLPDPIGLLEIKGPSLKGKDHLLQLIFSLGLDEGSLGDLLVVEGGFQLIVSPFALETLQKGLKAHGDLLVIQIESSRLEKGEGEGKEFPITVASMRLDAVASLGYGTSRSKMKREILMEKLKVNWKVEKDPARLIIQHDIISMDNRGRLEIQGVLGTSKRGRVKLLLKRYS